MLFKNALVFKLTEQLEAGSNTIGALLEQKRFAPCLSQQTKTMGFVPPLESTGLFILQEQDAKMFCVKFEEKVLPSSAVNDAVQAKIKEQDRALSNKERREIKENVIADLLPRALTKSKKVYGYIDKDQKFIIIDTASTGAAEDVLSLLRKALGSLPCVPLNVKSNPYSIMSDLLSQEAYAVKLCEGFELGNDCELISIFDDDKAVVKFQKQDLSAQEVLNHLTDGKCVSKLALTYNDRVSFVVNHQLGIKKLNFLELVQERIMESEPDDQEHAFRVDFIIMQDELGKMLNALIAAFGGICEDA